MSETPYIDSSRSDGFEEPVGATSVPPSIPSSPPARERRSKYVVLFLLTLATTTLAGAAQYLGFLFDLGNSRPPAVTALQFALGGLWYSVPVLAILAAHEFGHYFACRYYGVSASLPYFIPFVFPFAPFQTGTLGAVIRIRQQIPTKRQLFDIGIAGPIAGFLVAIPVLVLGVSLSRVVRMPPNFRGMEFGEPLLFQAITWLFNGTVPDGYALNLHPVGWAAWFGLLATALNLFPIGQLDGGHISYAVFGRRSTILSVLTMVSLVGLTFFSGSYLLWTILTALMLLFLGPHHPRTIDEDVPLDVGRTWLAAFAALMLALSFTPVPMALVGF